MNTQAPPTSTRPVTVRVGPQGRIVIPAELRRALSLDTGDTLVAKAQGQTLVLERPAQIIERLQGRLAPLRGETSPVDELLAERKREVARENEEASK